MCDMQFRQTKYLFLLHFHQSILEKDGALGLDRNYQIHQIIARKRAYNLVITSCIFFKINFEFLRPPIMDFISYTFPLCFRLTKILVVTLQVNEIWTIRDRLTFNNPILDSSLKVISSHKNYSNWLEFYVTSQQS